MIFQFLFIILKTTVLLLFGFLPPADVLPWGMDPIVSQAISYFNAFIVIFPPIGVVFQAFILYLGFRLAMLLIKLILGNRTPAHN